MGQELKMDWDEVDVTEVKDVKGFLDAKEWLDNLIEKHESLMKAAGKKETGNYYSISFDDKKIHVINLDSLAEKLCIELDCDNVDFGALSVIKTEWIRTFFHYKGYEIYEMVEVN